MSQIVTVVDRRAIHRQIAGSVWSSPFPEEALYTLCRDIGARVPGTSAFGQAQTLLATELRNAGATVWTETVEMLSWCSGEANVDFGGPFPHSCGGVHLVHSAAGDVSGQLLRVDDAGPASLDRLGSCLRDAVVIKQATVSAGPVFTPLLLDLERLAERGVAGVITVGTYVPGQAEIDIAAVEKGLPIPAVGVSPEDGRALIAACGVGGGRARIRTTGQSQHVNCSNLIADFPPSGDEDGIILLGAHLDTFHLNVGALDNLTGVVTAVEVARTLAQHHECFRRRLRVVIYTGEEYGFCGSKSYIATHRDELDLVRFVYNMDTLWESTARGIAVMESPSMRDYIHHRAKEAHRNVEVRDLFCMSSDYLPFLLEGVPAARPAGFDSSMPPWSHTSLDVLENVSSDWIRMNAMVHGQILAALLCDGKPLPAERKYAAQMQSTVEQYGAAEAMRAYGFERYSS